MKFLKKLSLLLLACLFALTAFAACGGDDSSSSSSSSRSGTVADPNEGLEGYIKLPQDDANITISEFLEGDGSAFDRLQGEAGLYYEVETSPRGTIFLAFATQDAYEGDPTTDYQGKSGQYALYTVDKAENLEIIRYDASEQYIPQANGEYVGEPAITLRDGRLYSLVNCSDAHNNRQWRAVYGIRSTGESQTVRLRFVRVADAINAPATTRYPITPKEIAGQATVPDYCKPNAVSYTSSYFFDANAELTFTTPIGGKTTNTVTKKGFYRMGTVEEPGEIIYAAVDAPSRLLGATFSEAQDLGNALSLFYGVDQTTGNYIVHDYINFITNDKGGDGETDLTKVCYVNAANADGLYPVNQELYDFLNLYVKINPLVQEEGATAVASEKQWLAACSYYRVAKLGSIYYPVPLTEGTNTIMISEAFTPTYFNLKWQGGDDKSAGYYTLTSNSDDAWLTIDRKNYSGKFSVTIEADEVNGKTFMLSYGYFFDEACTKPVPYSYLTTRSVDLYVGFTDPAPIVGEYYVQTENANEPIKLLIQADGTALCNDGANEITVNYQYDGEVLLLEGVRFAKFFTGAVDTETSVNEDTAFDLNRYILYHFQAVLTEQDVLELYDGTYFTAKKPLTAYKANNRLQGVYYLDDTALTRLTFRPDGTGVYEATGAYEEFTYTCNATTVSVTLSDETVKEYARTALLSFDALNGVWQKSASVNKFYSFDGRSKNGAGIWKSYYRVYARNGGNVTSSDETIAQGTYEWDDVEKVSVSQNGDVTHYEFDGKGELSNGGSFIVNGETEYGYKQNGEAFDVYAGNEKVGSIIRPDKQAYYLLTIGTTQTQLFVHNEFMGNWAISGAFETLKIGPTDLDGNITASYKGQNVKISYYNSATLTLSYFETNGMPVTNYMFLIYDENNVFDCFAISEYNSTIYNDYRFCSIADEMMGEWTQAQNPDFSISFDGSQTNYNNGTANLAYKGFVTSYYYRTYADGSLLLWSQETYDGTTLYYTIEWCDQTDADAYVNASGKAFKRLEADSLFKMQAKDENGYVYTFDGRNTSNDVWGIVTAEKDGETVTYTYDIVAFNTDRTATLTLKDESGKEYTATLNYRDSENVTIKLEEK